MAHHSNEDVPCPLCEEKLDNVHPYMIGWFHEIKAIEKNVHISCAYRGEAEQEAAFKAGKSNAHFPKSAHNKSPVEALDLFFLTEDGVAAFPLKRYNGMNLYNLANEKYILWGGTFKSLGDSNHFQYAGKSQA